MQYNPSQQQPQGLYQQNAPVGPFQGINNYIENMTGGKIGDMDAAALMAAAYMMFGSRFGWMGKVASMRIGGYTVKDMQQRRQVMQMVTMQAPRQQPIRGTSSSAGMTKTEISLVRMRPIQPLRHQLPMVSRITQDLRSCITRL